MRSAIVVYVALTSAAWYTWRVSGLSGDAAWLGCGAIAGAIFSLARGGRVRLFHRALALAIAGIAAIVATHVSVWLLVGRDVPDVVPWFTVVVARFVGLDAAFADGAAVIETSVELARIRPSWFDLGAHVAIACMAALLMHAYIVNHRARWTWRSAMDLLLVSFLLIVRHAAIAIGMATWVGYFAARTTDAAILTSHGLVAMSTLVLVLLPVGSLLRPAERMPSPRSGRGWLSGGTALCGVVLLTGLLVDSNAGLGRGNRLLVDDAHIHDWEVAGARFTTEWRGDMSVYSCSSAFEALGDTYEVAFHRNGPITPRLLEDVDLLFLKVPSERFEPAECRAIESFLREGGGVVAIGDHTDLFGCNTFLNEVLEPTGVRFLPTAVSTWENWQARFSREFSASWLPRPVSNMSWLTGCNIAVPLLGSPLVVDRRTYADEAVYSNRSYFGDGFCEPCESCGPNVLVASADLGRGRVVACGDGTIFTNFAVFRPGRYELLRSLVAHARRGPRVLGYTRLALALLGLLGVGYGMHGVSTSTARSILALAMLLAATVLWDGARTTARGLDREEPWRPRPTAAFLGDKANYLLAPTIGGGFDFKLSYDSLFVEIQRFGLRPRWEPNLERAMERDRVILIPNVLPRFSDDELKRLRAWIEAGGILWIGSSEVPGTSEGAQQVGRGVGLDGRSAPAFVERESVDGAEIRGWRRGRGWLFYASGAGSFSRDGMGHPFPEPNDETLPKYRIVDRMFAVWAEHCGIDQEERFRLQDVEVSR